MEDKRYAGMTVNERLYVSGFLDEFDRAVLERNVPKVKEILHCVDLDESSIEPILRSLGLS